MPRRLVPAMLALMLAGLAPADAQQAGARVRASTDGVAERVDSFKRDTGDFFGRIFGRDESPHHAQRARATKPRSPPPSSRSPTSWCGSTAWRTRSASSPAPSSSCSTATSSSSSSSSACRRTWNYRFQEQGKGGPRPPPARTQVTPPSAPGQPVQSIPPAPPPAARRPRRSAGPTRSTRPRTRPRRACRTPWARYRPGRAPPRRPIVSADGEEAPRSRSACPAAARRARRSICPTLSAQARARPVAGAARAPGECGTALPPPPPRNPSATGGQQQAMLPPTRDAEGRVRPRLRLSAAQGLRARGRELPRLPEEISERPAHGRGQLLAGRKPVPAPALPRRGGIVPRRLDQVRKVRQGAGRAVAARPVARRAQREGSGLRDPRRDRAQVSARPGERETGRRAGTEA